MIKYFKLLNPFSKWIFVFKDLGIFEMLCLGFCIGVWLSSWEMIFGEVLGFALVKASDQSRSDVVSV